MTYEELDVAEDIDTWLVLFGTYVPTWWVRAIPGRWKHVGALGYSAQCNVWVYLDVSAAHMRVFVMREGKVGELVDRFGADAGILKYTRTNNPALFVRPGLWCTTAIAHLLGVRCRALRPTALWTHLIRQGAEILADGLPQTKDNHHSDGAGASPGS